MCGCEIFHNRGCGSFSALQLSATAVAVVHAFVNFPTTAVAVVFAVVEFCITAVAVINAVLSYNITEITVLCKLYCLFDFFHHTKTFIIQRL